MNIPQAAKDVVLNDAISRDQKTARRAALLAILLQERYLTREQLIIRVEAKLGRGCFGQAAWQDNFYRDMHVVKRALKAAEYKPAYSRRPKRPGYYIQDEPSIGPELAAALEGSVTEVDRTQIIIFRELSFKQRFKQGCSVSNLARQVVINRLMQRNPQLTLTEAQQLATQGIAGK